MNQEERVVTLYHGFSLKRDENLDKIIENIKENKKIIPKRESFFCEIPKDFMANLENVQDIVTYKTKYLEGENVTKWVFACGDIEGANNYAYRSIKNLNEVTPFIIEIEIDIKDLYVDGNDFLSNVANFINDDSIYSVVSDVYGNRGADFLRKIIAINEKSIYKAVDILCADSSCVNNHLNNNKIILGRHDTCFKSAFRFNSSSANYHVKNITELSYRNVYSHFDIEFDKLYHSAKKN